MKVVNLYIGGCSLGRHYINISNNAKDYSFEFNGCDTGIKVSVYEALKSDVWDIVTLQQVSHESFDYNTYQPYLNALSDYVRVYAPTAKIMLHQTWAYEEGSDRLIKELGFTNRKVMFDRIKEAYQKASNELGGVEIIPCGEAFENLTKNGVQKIHRDTFHASLGVGRYTLGCVFYEKLTGNSCIGNTFRDFDEFISEKDIQLAQESAHIACIKGANK